MPAVFFKLAERVDEPGRQQPAETPPFLVGESSVAPVGLRIGQIDLGVRDIKVAAKHHRLLLLEFPEVFQKRGIPLLHAVIESRESALRVGRVDGHQPPVGKLHGDRAALGVMPGRADSEGHRGRLLAEEHRCPRVTFLLRRIPHGLAALRPGDVLHITGLAFGFLQTEDVGLRRRHDLEQILLQDRPDAVYVPRDEFHAGIPRGFAGLLLVLCVIISSRDCMHPSSRYFAPRHNSQIIDVATSGFKSHHGSSEAKQTRFFPESP